MSISPRANPALVGQPAAQAALRRFGESGRLPHALLICGPRGVGKATLAFRLARFLLAPVEHRMGPADGLAVDPESGVFRRVAAGSHADLLTVEREWDPQRRRLRGEIVAEDAREIARFLHLTAAESGWRIVIVDGAEEMNRSAANALLKILEEPPRQTVLMLVSHNPGRLLPTVRSRCRRMTLDPLSTGLAAELLAQHRPDIETNECQTLAALAGGSIGRALELAEAGGIGLYRALIEVVGGAPEIEMAKLHALADRLARRDAESAYRASAELLSELLASVVLEAGGRPNATEVAVGAGAAVRRLASRGDPARWAALREEIAENFARTDALNLDRKQAFVGAFLAIADLSR